MYSPCVIDHSKRQIEEKLGLKLREYSLDEVQDMAFRLRDVEWPENRTSEVVATLDEPIQRYIVNELQMSKVDFRYWINRYCKIVDDHGQLVPIVPWPTQEALLEVVEKEEEKAWERWMRDPSNRQLEAKCALILLKARQLGGTVISEALLAHLVFFYRYTRAGIASDHIENSIKLWQNFIRMYDNLPPWMKPVAGAKTKAKNLHLDNLDSDVVVGAGNMDTTFGQGITVDTAHLTELSTWKRENANAIDEDLKPAFYSSRKHHSLLIMESTGQGGKGNFFHDQYWAAARGRSQFKSLFLAWYRDPNKWALPSEGVSISSRTQALMERIERESGFKVTKDQAAWYEITRADYEERGKLQLFLQEFPSVPEEAFQTGFTSVFGMELRERIRNEAKEPIAVFDYSPESRTFTPVDKEEYKKDPSPVKADNKLLIWEKPDPVALYTVGVDVSYGQDGGDSSAIEVMRVGDLWRPDEQVAEWRGTISPVELAEPVWIICHMYEDQIEDLPAKLAIEVNQGSPGIVTQTELIRRNYTNFYVMTRKAEKQGAWTKKLGWHTTPGTRPILTDKGTQAITSGGLVINSLPFVGEMDSFVANMSDMGKRKLEHAPGHHDDRIIALYIAYVVAHESEYAMDAIERARAWEMRNRPPENVVEFQNYSGRKGQILPKPQDALAEWEESIWG